MYKIIVLILLNACTSKVFASGLYVNGIVINSTSLLKIEAKLRDFNNKQYLEGHLYVPINIGSNAQVSFDMYYRRNDWIHLIKVKDVEFCRFIRNYPGKAFSDLEVKNGLRPGQCPLNHGHYHLNSTYINPKNMAYTIFPHGNLKVSFTCILKTTKQLLLQSVVYFTNI